MGRTLDGGLLLRQAHRFTLLFLALALALALPALAEPGRPSPSPSPAVTYPASGLKVGSEVIRPGEALGVIFGLMGPPDQVRAMRSKRAEDDYVMFSYFSQGFSLDINQKNVVQGILVETREADVSGVPFRVGDTKDAVQKAWGDPDRTQSKVMAYWRRGVYVGTDEAGNVTSLFLTAPGQIDKPDQGSRPVGG